MRRPGGDVEVLRLEGLQRRFGDELVLPGVDLVMHTGDRIIVRGPNGSGKSTLLRCIAGVLQPSAGVVLVAGEPAGSLKARRALGASLSQDRSFYLRLTGRENLQFFARLRLGSKKAAAAVVRELEDELLLDPILDRRMAECSTGMIQQVGLARALIGNPSLVVLDEPTRSLDEEAAARLGGALESRPACAAVVTTHRRDDFPHGRTLELGR